MSPKNSRLRRWFAGVAVGLVTLVALFLPQVLGSRPMRAALEQIVSARLGFAVAIADADLSWRGPSVLRGLAIASADGFGGEPLFTTAAATIHGSLRSLFAARRPSRIELREPTLTVIQAPGGTSNLDRFIATVKPTTGAPWPRVDVSGGRLRIEDRAIESHFAADEIEATLAPAGMPATMPATMVVRARCATRDGFSRLHLETRAAGAHGDDASRCIVDVHGVNLGDLAPLLRLITPPGSRVAGALDVAIDVTRHGDGSVDCALNGDVTGMSVPGAWLAAIGLVPNADAGDVSDPHLSMQGRVTFDASKGQAEFESFAVRSTFFELRANGRVCTDAAAATAAPLDLHTAVNFDFLSRRGGPLAGTLLPFLGGTGYLELDAKKAEHEGFEVRAVSNRANFMLTNGISFNWPETAISATIEVGERLSSMMVPAFAMSLHGGQIAGSGEFRGANDFGLHATWSGDWDELRAFIGQWEFGSFWDGGGWFDADVSLHKSGTHWSLAAELKSGDLGLVFTPHDGIDEIDAYFFRGKPFTARVEADFDPTASVRTWTGRLAVDSPVCEIRDDTLTNVVIDATLADGLVTLNRVSGHVHDGVVTAFGTIALGHDAGAKLDLDMTGEDLALGGQSSEWAGMICPVFAAPKGPWNVTGTPRLSGALHVTATGVGPRTMANTAVGHGEFHWTAGELSGSPLLDRIAEPEPSSASRRIDGIDSSVEITNGMFLVDTQLRVPGRSPIPIFGSSGWFKPFDQEIELVALLPAAVVARHRDRLTGVRARIAGHTNAPIMHVPDVERWIELDAQGALDREIDAFLRP